jgi:YbbR domain-containing protein
VRVPYGVQVAQVTPATIPLSFERSGARTVPVVPAVEGEPAPGYVAGRITSEPAVVEVVGPVSLLGDLKNATTEPVSIDKATRAIRDTVTVGVANDNLRLRQPISATVTVEIAPVADERVMPAVAVRATNVPEGRSATVTPDTVRLIVRGPKDRLGALLDTALEPHVDLTGLKPGRMTLPVKVASPASDVEIVRIEPESVRVTIK